MPPTCMADQMNGSTSSPSIGSAMAKRQLRVSMTMPPASGPSEVTAAAMLASFTSAVDLSSPE